MDNTQHYLINMVDGRVILYTKQAARQINYHPISEAVAFAIGEGRVSAKVVTARIKANLINNQDAWDDLLKKKTTMNMRKTTIAPEDSEGMETTPDEDETVSEFDMPVDAGGDARANGTKTKGAKAGGKKNGAKSEKKDADESESEETAPDGDAGDDLDL